MKSLALILLLAAAIAVAQTSIPNGTVLPAQLNASINSHKSVPGKTITARIAQDVPLSHGQKIRAGSRVVGKIVRAQPARDGHPAEVTLRFDTLHFAHTSVPITANLRALASLMQVEDAQTPSTGPDRGTPAPWVIRNLVGGEVAYGFGGPVARGIDTVGTVTLDGVLVPVAANRQAGCRGEIAGNDQPQALWVFSSDACGVYGYPDVQIAHSGRTDPLGQITLTSKDGDFNIRSGSGILLRLHTAAAAESR